MDAGLRHDDRDAPARRSAAVVGLGALLLLVARVAGATSWSNGGRRIDLIGATDSGRSLVIVAWTAGAVSIVSAARSPWRDAGRLLRGVYLWWLLAVVAAVVALNPAIGGRALLQTVLAFRPQPGIAPIEGLAVGPLVLELAMIAIAAPVLAAFVAARGWRPLVLLGAAGALAHLLLVTGTRAEPFGRASWIVTDLHLVAVGLVVVRLARAGVLRRVPTVALAASAAFGALLHSAFVLPFGAERGALDVAASLAGAGILAMSITAWALGRPSRAGRTGRSAIPRPSWWLALAAPGVLLFHETVFLALARQQRERFTDGPLGLRLDGSSVPIAVWTALTAAAIGWTVSGCHLTWALRRVVSSPGWRASWAAPVAVVAGGFVWRVHALLTIAPDRVDGGDPLFYHTTANVLAAGRGFPEPLNWMAFGDHVPSAFHGPLFPMVLSLSSRLGGTTYLDHRMMAALLGSVVVLGVLLVGRKIAGPTVGLVAGSIAAVYPNLWLIDGVLFPEGLMAALVCFTILAAYHWIDRPTARLAAVIGGLVGLTALTRGEGVFLMVLLVAPMILRDRRLARAVRWRQLAIAAVACLAVLAPWFVRNTTTFAVPVPLSTNGNELLVYANCDETYHGKFLGFWYFDCQERIRRTEGEPPGDEAEKAQYWREIGADYAIEHADRLPVVVAARVGRQWELFRPWQNAEFAPIEGRSKNGARVGLITYYALVAAAVPGVLALRRRRVPLLPLTSQLLSVTITAAAAYGTVRFRAPAEPVLCILAGTGLVAVAPRWRRRLAPRLTAIDPPIEDPDAFVLGGRAVRWRWSWPTALGMTAVAAVALAPVRGLYRATGGTMEEGFMLAFPQRMARGAVANVDFLHLYGPGALDVLVAWYALFGDTLEAERTFGLLQNLGIIAGLWAVGRAWGRGAATVTAGLSVFLVMTPIGLTAMAWNGAVALGLWSTVLGIRARLRADTGRPATWSLAGAGACAGLALSFRPDLVVALALAHVVLGLRHRAWKPFVVGALAGSVSLLVHLVRIGPGTALRTMVLDPVRELRPGRELPRPPSWNVLDGALQAIAEDVPPWWRFPALAASHQLFIWFFALPVLAVAVLVVALRLRRGGAATGRSTVLLGSALYGIGLLPQAFQRPDSTHLTWVSMVTFPLLVPAIIELVAHRAPRAHPRVRVAVAGGAVAALLFVVSPFFTYRTYLLHVRVSAGNLPPAYLVERDGRSFYMGDARPWRATAGVIEALDRLSVPGESLVVGPADLSRTWYADTFFYYMFPELEPGTYFMEMDPGLADAEDSPLADELRRTDWLLLTSFWAGWREPNTSMVPGSQRANDVVREQFCLVESFEDGLVELFRRCDLPPPG